MRVAGFLMSMPARSFWRERNESSGGAKRKFSNEARHVAAKSGSGSAGARFRIHILVYLVTSGTHSPHRRRRAAECRRIE